MEEKMIPRELQAAEQRQACRHDLHSWHGHKTGTVPPSTGMLFVTCILCFQDAAHPWDDNVFLQDGQYQRDAAGHGRRKDSKYTLGFFSLVP